VRGGGGGRYRADVPGCFLEVFELLGVLLDVP
jgi:hypothetical protein